MGDGNPSPHRSLLILLGAADFSKYLGKTEQIDSARRAFASAAQQVWDFFGDATDGLGIPLDNRLHLFDLENVYYQVLSSRIEEFIHRRDRAIGDTGASDIIIYYIGHGGFFRDRYFLALRETEKAKPYETGYPFEALAESLRRVASRKRKYFILDCCYSGAAFTHLHQSNPAEHVAIEAGRSFPESVELSETDRSARKGTPSPYGTALLSAVAKGNRAMLREDLSSTLFTSTFLDVLKTSTRDEGMPFSLLSLCDGIRNRIEDTALLPQCHTPEVALGDIARLPLFRLARGKKPRDAGLLPSIFEVDVFAAPAQSVHCVVVSAERPDQIDGGLVADYVRQAVDKFGLRIVDLAASARHSREGKPASKDSAGGPGSGRARVPEMPRLSDLPLTEAFASKFSLERAVEAMCHADVAIFDIEGYQPAAMILLGIRSVVRRGITMCVDLAGARGETSGADDRGMDPAGSSEAQPFNLQTIRVTDLSRVRSGARADLLGRRILTGLRELRDLPHYLDLPAFDAVRRLGVEAQAYLPVGYDERVLVLCSFSASYRSKNWTNVEEGLAARLNRRLNALRAEGALKTSADTEPQLARLSDLPSTRLVTQTLYEAIRNTDMCVIDWSESKPNVMFELGVRLAVNALGAIHIAAEDKIDTSVVPRQISQLKALFRPIKYPIQRGSVSVYDAMIHRFETSRQNGRQEPDCIVYEKIGAVLEQTYQRVAPDVVSNLIQDANLLSSDDESTGVSPVLYHDVDRSVRARAAEAATERRIAAWLYMHRRYALDEIARDHARQIEFRRLAVSIRRALKNTSVRDQAYAASVASDVATQVAKLQALKSLSRLEVKYATIEEAMGEAQVIIDEAKLDREKGADGIQQAIGQLKSAVKLLEGVGWSAGVGARAVASDEQKKAAAQMADCLGMIGGNYRRLGHARGALTWFKKGRKIEQDERFNIDSTYNLGNEISTSVELGKRASSPAMKTSLRKALMAMKRRTEGNRHRDRWAWADQGQFCLLLGDYDDAQKAYQRFLELGDRKSTLTSVVPVLKKLHDALVAVQDPSAETLQRGIEYLEREAMKQI